MMKTMTIGAAARWVGVSPRMLGLFLTGRLVDSLSEIDVDCDGLDPFLVASMPGSGAEDAPRTFPVDRARAAANGDSSRRATKWGAVPPATVVSE